MKAHRGKAGVAPWVLEVAIAEAKRQMSEQADDVCRRCVNEMVVAMHQANLSPKTIRRTVNILKEVVIPRADELRESGLKDRERYNDPSIHDGDDWLEYYCREHDLPYEEPERKI